MSANKRSGFKKRKFTANLTVISLISLSILLPAFGLWAIANGMNRLRGPGVFFVAPSIFFWLIVVFLPGLIFGFYIGISLGRRIFGRDFFKGEVDLHELPGELSRISRFSKLGGVFLLVVVPLLGFDWYARFEERELVSNSFFGLREERHPYSSIHAIEKQMVEYFNVKLSRKERFAVFSIEFSDGYRWESGVWGNGGLGSAFQEKIVDFVAARSRAPVYGEWDAGF